MCVCVHISTSQLGYLRTRCNIMPAMSIYGAETITSKHHLPLKGMADLRAGQKIHRILCPQKRHRNND